MDNAEHMPSEDRLRELLVGRKVASVEVRDERPGGYSGLPPIGLATLDDGTVLKLYGHEGGCTCSSGDYQLTELNRVDNIITNVIVDENPDEDYAEDGGYYRIFVYAENEAITLASFEGTDGNGYYGTGWWLEVSGASPQTETTEGNG